MTIPNDLLDALMKDYKNPEDLIGETGLLKQLTKQLLERAMQAEMTEHLGIASDLFYRWRREYRSKEGLAFPDCPYAFVYEERAWLSASNQRGGGWNSGVSHMNDAFRRFFFDNLGWFRWWIPSGVSSVFHEPPDGKPHVRWRGRTEYVRHPTN